MKLEGLKVNFLGDSITEGVGVESPDSLYHALLKKEAKLAAARNYGISGTRLALQTGTPQRKWDPREDGRSFCERFSEMDDDADVVVVFGGTNDYGHGDASIGHKDDRMPETFYGACHSLIRGLQKKYPQKPIVFLLPLRRADEERLAQNDRIEGKRKLTDYIEILREVTALYAIPVLDLYNESGIEPYTEEVREKYMPDGLHPNEEGHKIIAKKLRDFLEAL